MTPDRLILLVAKALGRDANHLELQAWGAALARVLDDDGDRALVDHRRTSTYPPTPADLVRLAIGYGNERHDRAVAAELEHARANAVPPTPEYLDARRRFAAAQAARTLELERPLPDETDPQRMAQARAELDALRPDPAAADA